MKNDQKKQLFCPSNSLKPKESTRLGQVHPLDDMNVLREMAACPLEFHFYALKFWAKVMVEESFCGSSKL